MKTIKIELTRGELKAVQYHIDYDKDTLRGSTTWESLEIKEEDSDSALSKIEVACLHMYDNESDMFEDWTDEKLKEEAISYDEMINKVGCYGCSDLRALQGILIELENRGIEPKRDLHF